MGEGKKEQEAAVTAGRARERGTLPQLKITKEKAREIFLHLIRISRYESKEMKERWTRKICDATRHKRSGGKGGETSRS